MGLRSNMGRSITLHNRTEGVIRIRIAALCIPRSRDKRMEYDVIRKNINPHGSLVVETRILGRPSRYVIARLLAHAEGDYDMKLFGNCGDSLRLKHYSELFFDMDATGLTLSGIQKPKFRPFKCIMMSDHDGQRKEELISTGSICIPWMPFPLQPRRRNHWLIPSHSACICRLITSQSLEEFHLETTYYR